MGGMTNRFTYKNFDLSFMISFQTGASLFDYPGYFLTYSDGVRVGSFNMTADVAGNYWTKPGDKVDNPKPIYNNPYRSDGFLPEPYVPPTTSVCATSPLVIRFLFQRNTSIT